MAAVVVTPGLIPTRPFVRTSPRTRRCIRREAFSVIHLPTLRLHLTIQRRTRRSYIPILLLSPVTLPHRHTIIITHPLRPNYARVWTMHGRLVSAHTHSNTLLIYHRLRRLRMHQPPLTLPLTSSPVLAVTRMILYRGGVGSSPVLTRTSCLEFGGVRHPTSALPAPRPLISIRTDWPERAGNRLQPAFIDTTTELGKAPPSIHRRLVSTTQALREAQMPLRRIPPLPRSKSATCIDGWMHSRVVRADVSWIMSVLKTWLLYINETVNSESSCAGNEASGYKKRIRAFVGGFVDAQTIVLVPYLSSRRDWRTARGYASVRFDSHCHRRLSTPPSLRRRCMHRGVDQNWPVTPSHLFCFIQSHPNV